MGCKAMTPHLVGLAKELEGEPFHFVATHCQQRPRETVVAYARSRGIRSDSPNISVTSFGRHSKVKGNGYVPYSLVFDHHGDLAYHHMSGDYHGGDGLELLEVARRLVAEVPELYLGREPFVVHPELAAQFAEARDLAKLERALILAREANGAAESLTELDRLAAALEGLASNGLAELEHLLATDPAAYAKAAKAIEKRFAKTTLEPQVEERVLHLDTLEKPSKEIAKRFASIEKRLAKLAPCESCDRARADSHVVGCPTCARANATKLSKIAVALEELALEAKDLPFQATVLARLEELR